MAQFANIMSCTLAAAPALRTALSSTLLSRAAPAALTTCAAALHEPQAVAPDPFQDRLIQKTERELRDLTDAPAHLQQQQQEDEADDDGYVDVRRCQLARLFGFFGLLDWLGWLGWLGWGTLRRQRASKGSRFKVHASCNHVAVVTSSSAQP